MTDDRPLAAPERPRPFRPQSFPRAEREAAGALWRWHAALLDPAVPDSAGEDYFAAEQARVAAGEAPGLVPAPTWRAVLEACRAHDLALDEVAAQVQGAGILARPPVRFATAAELTAFIRQWATPHALLLADLAGHRHSWQERLVHELARGFFLTARLVDLPADLEADRLFVPTDEMEQAGVTLDQMRSGQLDERLRRLLWKQTVRIRDALAHGLALVKELPRRPRNELKRSWLGALELIRQIERSEYDLWNDRPALSTLSRMQVRLQALLGSAADGR